MPSILLRLTGQGNAFQDLSYLRSASLLVSRPSSLSLTSPLSPWLAIPNTTVFITHTLFSLCFQWYYLFRSRTHGPALLPTQLKWTATPRGKRFLQSGKWQAEVSLGSRLYQGPAGQCIQIKLKNHKTWVFFFTALPLYSVTRSFCKELLCEAFNTLLLPPASPSPSQPSTTDTSREEFKYILTLAQEATSSLLASHGSPSSCVSGERSRDCHMMHL